MYDDDTRGLEGPDRSTASHTETETPHAQIDGGTDSVRDRLATIDRLTHTLLVELHEPAGTAVEGVDAETRAEAAHHVRQIRAAATQVGLELVGPTATLYYCPVAKNADNPIAAAGDAFATTYDGPAPDAYGREHDRPQNDTHDRSPSDADRS